MAKRGFVKQGYATRRLAKLWAVPWNESQSTANVAQLIDGLRRQFAERLSSCCSLCASSA